MTKGKQIAGMVLILCIVLLVATCVPAAAPTPAPQAPTPSGAPAPAPAAVAPLTAAKPAWEMEWEKTLQAAKQEGLVTFFSGAGREVQIGLREGFKRKFGIREESIAGVSGLVASKILAERKAGIYLWDIMIAGAGVQVSTFKPGGGTVTMEPALILPDVTDPKVIKQVWYGGELPWVDKDRHVLAVLGYVTVYIAFNTNLVKPGEIKSWDDLLDPKWKGKILFADPTLPLKTDGSLMLMLYEVKGEAWVRKFAQQVAVIIGNPRLGLEWLAQGKYPIFIPPMEALFFEFLKAGAPIASVDTDDPATLESGTGCVSLIGNAPHPNAAKVFLNWFLSKEGQTIMSQASMSASLRLDVPTEGLPSYTLPNKPGRNYWVKTREEVVLKVSPYRAKSKEIFGFLMK